MRDEAGWLFDEIWVQETYEPRIGFNDYLYISKKFLNPGFVGDFKYFNIEPNTVHNIAPQSLVNDKDLNIIKYSAHSKFNIKMALNSAEHLQNIIKTGYRFSFANNLNLPSEYVKNSGPNYMKLLPDYYDDHGKINNLHHHLEDNNLLAEGSIEGVCTTHQTIKGNEYIGNLLNKSIYDKGI